VQVRFLRVRSRIVEVPSAEDGRRFTRVESLDAGGQLWTTWDEATEHQVDLGPFALGRPASWGSGDERDSAGHVDRPVELEASSHAEELRDRYGRLVGRLVREQEQVSARIEVSTNSLEGPFGLTRLRVRVENLTAWTASAGASRDETVRHSLVAVHVLAAVDEGRFVSLLDPPEYAQAAVSSCTNLGGFPVLIGGAGEDSVILSSPIILYDHPEVAPESQGDMFDATEIDEILALRILTMTDDEKREARSTDELAASIIDRCDAMPPEIFERLHGAIRSLRPSSGPEPEVATVPWWHPETDAAVDPAHDTIRIGLEVVGKGTRVLLNPTRRADAQDLFLAGKSAVVAGIFHDVDGDVHLAVVLEDDPASEMHEWYGRYLYFHPEEIKVLEGAS